MNTAGRANNPNNLSVSGISVMINNTGSYNNNNQHLYNNYSNVNNLNNNL